MSKLTIRWQYCYWHKLPLLGILKCTVQSGFPAHNKAVACVTVDCHIKYRVCCSIYNFGIRRKWQLEISQVSTKFCFNLGINVMNTFKLLKVDFREQKMGITQILEWFSNLKKKRDFCWKCKMPWTLIDKQNKWNVVHIKAFLPKTEESLYMKLLTCCKFHSDQFGSFWRTISTCVRSPPFTHHKWSLWILCAKFPAQN